MIMIHIPEHDESMFPVTLGSPLRVPMYAWSRWGIEGDYNRLNDYAEAEYAREWRESKGKQHNLVETAANNAGIGECNPILRKSCADAVAKIVDMYRGGVSLIDIGGGDGRSAAVIWDVLADEQRSRIKKIAVNDCSDDGLEVAMETLRKKGAPVEIIRGSDIEIPMNNHAGKYDIVTGVASIHHHARIPFDVYHALLRRGGFAVFADWHNSIWEDPYRVCQLLEKFPEDAWPKGKEEGLKHFIDVYTPQSDAVRNEAVKNRQQEEQANDDISRFWLQATKDWPIWPLEGHRPVDYYADGMKYVGFNIPSKFPFPKREDEEDSLPNPFQIIPGTALLQRVVGNIMW